MIVLFIFYFLKALAKEKNLETIDSGRIRTIEVLIDTRARHYNSLSHLKRHFDTAVVSSWISEWRARPF